MRTKTPAQFVVGLMAAALLLSACGGAGDDAAVAPLETSFEKLGAREAVVGEPGTAIDAGGGITISVSDGRRVDVSEAVTGVEDLAELGTVNAVDITVTNGSEAVFAPFAMTVQVLGSDGVTPCTDVFDDASNIVGTPFDDIDVGGSVTFSWGYFCDGSAGDAVTVRILVDGEGTPIDVPVTLVD